MMFMLNILWKKLMDLTKSGRYIVFVIIIPKQVEQQK